MKKLVIAGIVTLTATAAFAGGMEPPVMEPMIMAPEVVEQAANEQIGDEWVLALMAFLTIVVMGVGG